MSRSTKNKPYPSTRKSSTKNKDSQSVPEPIPGSSTEQDQPGPSWDDFKRLQDSIKELTSLVKQNMTDESRGTPATNVAQDACASNPVLINDPNTMQVHDNEVNNHQPPVVDNDKVDQAFNVNQVPVGDNPVQASINEYLQSFVNPTQMQGEKNFYNPPGRPIDLKVSDKLKQKIWASEYIDISLLLDPDDSLHQSFTIVSKEGEPLRLSQTRASKSIQSLGQWCSAFEIYLTVYCSKFPEQLPKLMTYMNAVKQLAHRDGDYVTYDREFRYMRQSNNVPWDTIHTGLWLECRDILKKKSKQNKNNNSFRPQQNKNNNNLQHPVGYCFRFHSFGKCGRSSCSFNHSCYKCFENHPVTRCQKAQSDSGFNGNKQDNQKTQPKQFANSNKQS